MRSYIITLLFVIQIPLTLPAQPQESTSQSHLNNGTLDIQSTLDRLGAKMEKGMTLKQLKDYSRHFDSIDRNIDGRHSKQEYIENGNYLTPMARRGIFNAADNNRDGFVSKAEYILNRIITDEAKSIIQKWMKTEMG